MGDESGPVIVEEPENRVDFSNSTGAALHCAVKGRPAPSVIWTRAEDGTAVGDVPGLRKVSCYLVFLNLSPFQPPLILSFTPTLPNLHI